MSLLLKSEIQHLKGQKHVSRSYEYKLKSVIRKKVANLMDKYFALLSTLFPNPDLTEIGKEESPFKATIRGSNPTGASLYPNFQIKILKRQRNLSERKQILEDN